MFLELDIKLLDKIDNYWAIKFVESYAMRDYQIQIYKFLWKNV